jgi:hypothetical protein
VVIQRVDLRGIRACIQSIPEISYNAMKRRCFQRNNLGMRVYMNFVIILGSENRTVKSKMFPQCSVHKCNSTSPDGKTDSHIDHVLIVKR